MNMRMALVNTQFIREVGYAKWMARTALRQFHKRILRREHHLAMPGGERMILPPQSHFATEAYVTGCDVDWGSEALLYALMRGEGAFLDIGANIGYYALYMHSHAIRTFAFEPDPRVIPWLRRNVRDHHDIEVIEMGVGRENGRARFTLASAGELSHLTAAGAAAAANDIDIEVVTINSFVAERALRVEAIKTDVEGYDLEVLLGGQRMIGAQRPLILSEAEPSQALHEFARSLGYMVLGYARDRASRAISFIDIAKISPSQVTKMLFLVPSERADQVRALA